jgi:hypothetical protein
MGLLKGLLGGKSADKGVESAEMEGSGTSLLFFFLLLIILFSNCELFDDGCSLLFFFLLLVIIFCGGGCGGGLF